MAVSLAKEVLRALQDSVPLHETVFAEHAKEAADKRIPAQSGNACPVTPLDVAAGAHGGKRMASLRALVNALHVADNVLDWRCWMGKR